MTAPPPPLIANAHQVKESRALDGYQRSIDRRISSIGASLQACPKVEREQVLSKCGWSPFEGTNFRSRIASTWVNGHFVWDGRQLVGGPRGMRLAFDR